MLALACSDQVPTQVEQTTAAPQLGVTDPFNSADQCMGDDAVQYFSLVDGVNSNSDPATVLNCTSNDIFIAFADVSQVFDPTANGGAGAFVDFDASNPPHCSPGEDITLKMVAHLGENAESERTDIGVWIATDGGDAQSGDCNHYNLTESADGDNDPPFDDGDDCHDLSNKATTGSIDLGTITVPCVPDEDFNLKIGSCLAWKTPNLTDPTKSDDAVCPDNRDGTLPAGQPTDFRAGTLPSNKSKCNCEPFSVPIIVDLSATIEVKKVCTPTNDPGTFDLLIDGSNAAGDDKACGGTTGAVSVSAGTSQNPGASHSVSENDFTTANYTSTYACTRDPDGPTGASQFTSGTGTSVPSFTVNPNDAIVCTFTNVRKAQLRIKKTTVPSGETQAFTFTPTGWNSGNTFDLTDGQTQASELLTPGQYSAAETVPTGWDLTSRACVLTGTATTKSFTSITNGVQVNLAAGEDVTCTFTNTKRGSVIINKETNPDGASGSFSFSQNVDASGNFSLGDGGSKTFSNVVPGNYTVTESDPAPAFDLESLDCDDDASTTPSTTSGRVATVKVDPGETVTCTYTNKQRATVTANKRESGTLPLVHTWSFEIRVGATTLAAGTVIATGTANTSTGVITFACSPNPNSYCGNVSGVANIIPGTYQFCETGMPAGYHNNFTGFTPLGATAEGGDNSTECKDITLSAGGSGVPGGIPDPIDNTPPPGGDARTIGYWKNWASCATSNGGQYQRAVNNGFFDKTLDGNLPQTLGSYTVSSCTDAVYILNKQDRLGAHKKKANDAAYALAAQLLAAKLSIHAGAGTCSAVTTAITQADALLTSISYNATGNYLIKASADRTTALNLAATLDSYNNNTLCP